ncbi:putative amidophosphoribosyltransferase [Mycolicibacterium smegmatis]|nr:putative amidophosphoribosyltransferase [Mycolicibacterium smegmatis]
MIRETRITCAVCCTPVDDYDRCYRCNQHQYTAGIADLVAPLTYAAERTQSGILLRHYKDDVSEVARQQHSMVIRRALYLGIMLHQNCIEKRVGQPVYRRVMVPSLSNRPGVHPFAAITREMNAISDQLSLVPAATATSNRIVAGTQFVIAPPQDLSGKHILVLDDTWTTGSRTQSAALTLRAAGARYVSVMVVGRWLSPGYGNNAEFIKTRLKRDYDPRICPVTGGACP